MVEFSVVILVGVIVQINGKITYIVNSLSLSVCLSLSLSLIYHQVLLLLFSGAMPFFNNNDNNSKNFKPTTNNDIHKSYFNIYLFTLNTFRPL